MTSPIRRKTLPPRRYRTVAKQLRKFAQQLEERCEPATSRELASLTSAIHGLSRFAQSFSQQHRKAAQTTAIATND